MIVVYKESPIPPYEQIRAQLARQITERRLPVGARLPTIRQLARDLDVALNTVARAYRELEHSGLVETRGRSGTFVTSAGDRTREKVRQAASEYATTALRSGIAAEEALTIVRAALGLQT